MFPYNPTVQNNSGVIQGEYNYKGAQLLAGGIDEAAGAVAKGMTDQARKGQMDRATLDMNLGKMDQYRQAGIMDDETYSKFLGMGINKQSGALAGFDATVVHPYLQKQQYQSQMEAKQMYGQGQQDTSAENFTY